MRAAAWAFGRLATLRLRGRGTVCPVTQARATKPLPVSGDDVLRNMSVLLVGILRKETTKSSYLGFGSVRSVLVPDETVNHCGLVGSVWCQSHGRCGRVSVRTAYISIRCGSRMWRSRWRGAGTTRSILIRCSIPSLLMTIVSSVADKTRNEHIFFGNSFRQLQVFSSTYAYSAVDIRSSRSTKTSSSGSGLGRLDGPSMPMATNASSHFAGKSFRNL